MGKKKTPYTIPAIPGVRNAVTVTKEETVVIPVEQRIDPEWFAKLRQSRVVTQGKPTIKPQQ